MTIANLTLPKKTTQLLMELTGEARADTALVLVIRDYARHKLGEIAEAIEIFEKKYEMPFSAYRQVWETKEQETHYDYEVEQDYLEWEALVTRHARLEKSLAWLP